VPGVGVQTANGTRYAGNTRRAGAHESFITELHLPAVMTGQFGY
jgi:hypothetical protein